jgi:hypothetical protein
MSSLQTTGGTKRTEHPFYVEIVTDITTRNTERKDT